MEEQNRQREQNEESRLEQLSRKTDDLLELFLDRLEAHPGGDGEYS